MLRTKTPAPTPARIPTPAPLCLIVTGSGRLIAGVAPVPDRQTADRAAARLRARGLTVDVLPLTDAQVTAVFAEFDLLPIEEVLSL